MAILGPNHTQHKGNKLQIKKWLGKSRYVMDILSQHLTFDMYIVAL